MACHHGPQKQASATHQRREAAGPVERLLGRADDEGRDGVTFLYAATTESAWARSPGAIWLGPDVAVSGLGGKDCRLPEL
jgi:hypothetical protein